MLLSTLQMRPRPFRRLATPRSVARTARRGAVAAVLAAAACGGKDPYAPTATLLTASDTFILLPLSRAQAPYGSALDLRAQIAVRPGLEVSTLNGLLVPNFDVAFDVDSSGNIVALPPKLVTASQSVPRTAFQVSTTAFDALGSAPGGTYLDTTIVVKPGQTLVVQAQGVGAVCAVGTPTYSKLVIDSVATGGLLYLRGLIDPNCGFKSFASGVPTS